MFGNYTIKGKVVVVYLWVQKLINQVPMRPMQLNPAEAGITHQPRRINKLSRDSIDVLLRHFSRRRENKPAQPPLNETIAHIKRDSARRKCRSEDTLPT